MVIFGEVPVWSQLGGPFWDALKHGSPLCGGLSLGWSFWGCFEA